MTTTPIPDAAVEAAARAGASLLGLDFDDLDATDRGEALAYHEAVLTAALPLLSVPEAGR